MALGQTVGTNDNVIDAVQKLQSRQLAVLLLLLGKEGTSLAIAAPLERPASVVIINWQ